MSDSLQPHGLQFARLLCPWDFSEYSQYSEYSQEYWSRLSFPPPGDLPDPGIETVSLASPALADGFFTVKTPGKLLYTLQY